MYHCNLRFYLVGLEREASEALKEMPPFENFTHIFAESGRPDRSLAGQADVILADLRTLDVPEAVHTLIRDKGEQTQLILLTGQEQLSLLTESPGGQPAGYSGGQPVGCLSDVTDIWIAPLTKELLQFRFLRWQQNCRQAKDLWQTRHFWDVTINSVPNLIWYKTKEGIHEKVNDSFCGAVNKSRQQIEGRGHAYIWDVEQDDPACVESERVVMETEQTCVAEEIIQTGAGLRTLSTFKSPLYDLDGSVMGTVGVAIDVTRERVYEKQLLQKNQTLERLFTTMDCGVLTHSLDGSRVLDVNRAALKLLGYDSMEALESGFSWVAPTVVLEDQPKLRECIQSLKKQGDSASLEYRVKHKDGKLIHVMGNIKLVEEGGELVYQRFLLDCTAQKLREQQERTELERQQDELVQALSVDYNLVCYYELDTGEGGPLRIHDCPYGVLEDIFTGDLPITERMERYIGRCVYKDDRELLRRALAPAALAENLDHRITYVVNYRTFCGGEIQFFQMKAVRAGAWGAKRGVVLGFRNVDDETRQEMERTALLQDALVRANQASRAKSVFLSNMSHDIRTPMNAIVGFTTLALGHLDQREQVEGYLKKILTSGSHLVSLINDVLDMSRIESGKMQLNETPCSLPDIIHSLRSIVQADVRAKRLDFRIDMADVPDEDIYCDKLRLNQVLLNLLSNAVKYTPAGGTVSMRVMEKASAPADSACYEFRVRDSGIGMSAEFLDHLFEPFERERNSTISGIQGTGLGMAITKSIVDMMNGSIEVYSEQGVGSEFVVSFTFRLHKAPQEVPAAQEPGGRPHSAAHQDGTDTDAPPERRRAGHILLAEDNELNQEIAAAILTEAGFTVDIASNGRLAVDMLRGARPGYYDLVLMDVQMPVMDGYTATRAIRALEDRELASIPILAMTANAFEEDRKEAFQAGMNGHIAKPIDIGRLFEALDETMG